VFPIARFGAAYAAPADDGDNEKESGPYATLIPDVCTLYDPPWMLVQMIWECLWATLREVSRRMNKLAVGFSVLSTLLAVGCGDSPTIIDTPQTGRASFGLAGNDGFTLTAAIEIYHVDDDAESNDLGGSTIEDDALPTLDFELFVGSYTADLTSFTLFDGGVAVPGDDVEFDGFSQDPIVILPNADTPVVMTFLVGTDQTVTFTSEGAAVFSLAVVENECAAVCAVGAVCAKIDTNEPACAKTCDPELEDEDGGTDACTLQQTCETGTGGSICIDSVG
jgi:hypothetical protein